MTTSQTLPLTISVSQESSGSLFNRRAIMMSVTLYVAALITFILLQIEFGISPFGVSAAPHYLYQAESFLHGRWDLTLTQPLWDTIHLHGKTYDVYPPFPALLMLPFVAIFGLHTSDIFITTALSALNLPLLYLLLEQARLSGHSTRSQREHLIMSMLLSFGSINLYLSLGGRVWFTAQILCMTCALGSLLLAFRRHFGWSAALMGCAFLTRGTMALGFPLILYFAWQNGGAERAFEDFMRSLWQRRPAWDTIPWSRLLPPLAIFVGVIALFLLRNTLVFGSPLESGYNLMNQQNYPEIQHGVYSLYYVQRNLIASFFDFPRVTFASSFAQMPTVSLVSDGMGISVFITTPIFLFLFAKNSRPSALRVALWLTIALIVAQALLFCATGYYQFGARYLYDAYPFAFLLLGLVERRVDWRFVALGVFAIVINAMGAHQFWG
ncbi:MAG TPA: hypothetical protein VF812_19200 [Ktedonobacterales bacterium]